MLIAECFRKHFLELIFKGEMLLALSKTCKLSITYLGKKKKLGKGLASGPLESYWMSFAVLSNRYSVPPHPAPVQPGTVALLGKADFHQCLIPQSHKLEQDRIKRCKFLCQT